MVTFESNEALTMVEIFTNECEQIYNDIEEEHGKKAARRSRTGSIIKYS
jgi:hypothetical protein